MSFMNEIVFILLLLIITIYTILDGFDLGTGFWFLLANKRDKELMIKSIGPFWDGNEVWLLAIGGILFAGFADVYATVFSGFYIPFMLLLTALILRAVSLEFRKELASPNWTKVWNTGFIIGSLFPGFAYGLVVGNLIAGIPIDANKNFTGDLFTLFNPFALMTAIFALTLIITHSGTYLNLRLDESLSKEFLLRSAIITGLIGLFLVVVSFLFAPSVIDNFLSFFPLLIIPIAGFLSIAGTYYYISLDEKLKPFICSSLSIFFVILGGGIALFPNLVTAVDSSNSLTIYNSSSSEEGLFLLLLFAIVSIPIVLIYTSRVYLFLKEKIVENDLVPY